MKKILLISCVLMAVFSIDVMANKPKGERKTEEEVHVFKDGCLVIPAEYAKEFKNEILKVDADRNNCITEAELKLYAEKIDVVKE